MKLFVATKMTEKGQCYFDFENQFWVPTPLKGKRGLTENKEHADHIAKLFEHQDGKVHTFTIDVGTGKVESFTAHDSGVIPGVH